MGECGEDGGVGVEDVGGVEHVFGFLVDFLACAEDGRVQRFLLIALGVEVGQGVGRGCVGAEERGVYLVAEFGWEAEDGRGFLGVDVPCSGEVWCVWVDWLLVWRFWLDFWLRRWWIMMGWGRIEVRRKVISRHHDCCEVGFCI